jgi:hypothetical protein
MSRWCGGGNTITFADGDRRTSDHAERCPWRNSLPTTAANAPPLPSRLHLGNVDGWTESSLIDVDEDQLDEVLDNTNLDTVAEPDVDPPTQRALPGSRRLRSACGTVGCRRQGPAATLPRWLSPLTLNVGNVAAFAALIR